LYSWQIEDVWLILEEELAEAADEDFDFKGKKLVVV